MDDGIWNLIEQCWMHNPSERPTMEKIVEAYFSFLATLPSLIATLREVCTPDASGVFKALGLTTTSWQQVVAR